MAQKYVIARPPAAGLDVAWATRAIATIQNAIDSVPALARTTTVVTAPVTIPLTFDPASDSAATTAAVLANLILQLQAVGLIAP
jgi:hypothetical protein